MTLLAFGVAAYAVAGLVGVRSSFVQQLFSRIPAAAFGHLAGGTIAIVIGAFQVNGRLRNRYLSVHRWLGRLYLLGVTVGGVSAVVLATQSGGGLVAHFGFGLLGLCWLFSTWAAYLAIRRSGEEEHREWMLRSYALTLAAVTLRIYLPLSQMAGLQFEAAYPTIAWMCWVPNLLIVEWLVIRRRARLTPAL